MKSRVTSCCGQGLSGRRGGSQSRELLTQSQTLSGIEHVDNTSGEGHNTNSRFWIFDCGLKNACMQCFQPQHL